MSKLRNRTASGRSNLSQLFDETAQPTQKADRHTLGRFGNHLWRHGWIRSTRALVQSSVLEKIEGNFDVRHPRLYGVDSVADLA